MITQKIGNWAKMVLDFKRFLKFLLFLELWAKNKKVKTFKTAPNDLKFLYIIKIGFCEFISKISIDFQNF